MRYDIHFRSDVIEKIDSVVGDIHGWNRDDNGSVAEIDTLADFLTSFEHCALPDRPFLIGGADGSGDFPCVTYGDSFVYLVVAMVRLYESAQSGKLVEKRISASDIVELLWLPEDKKQSNEQFNNFFARLVDEPLSDICQSSDYYELCRTSGGGLSSPEELIETLIRPEAHDADNIGIQLLSTAEASVLIRLMKSSALDSYGLRDIYLIEDTTLALPMVNRKHSLFFEIAKRYACTLARQKHIVFLAISKSHNMPRMDLIEDMIHQNVPGGEHWFMRIPSRALGERKPAFLGTRSIPPVGAVSYLFRFHKSTPSMRLDIDIEYWKEWIWNTDREVMKNNEIQIFRDLDFASHDQRCYGYPYPIKASHDIVSMTDDERLAFRKQIINAAEKAGLKRKNFVDPSILTGHK